ncbi:ParB/RepB/Spo0J family partition protein [Pseudomonas tritici]|uniref:ParB/RepB/Spo0J family partition protein n=1 Tax=Pseudomonas tritici TaxID=2745518 RepID=UPI00387A8D2C
MKARNFSALGASSAASVNAGTIGVQKDKIVYVDAQAEVLYDPAENVRNGKLVDDGIEGLIELRVGMDASEQLQPIRLYPLPPEKLDPKQPLLKYGVGYGHRRMLCCRLTSKDHPAIGDKPRKVAAIIDVEWTRRTASYRRRCQIQENTQRVDLNPVELGQAILGYQKDLMAEEGRHVSQRELMETFGLREKTVWALLKAAEFHEIAKDVCHQSLLSDLDTMVTFDGICKQSEQLAQAIYDSLRVVGAPNNRAYIRQAKVMAEEPGYQFNATDWVWPDSVAGFGGKVAQPKTPAAPLVNSQQRPEPNPAPGTEPLAPNAETQQSTTSATVETGLSQGGVGSPGAVRQEQAPLAAPPAPGPESKAPPRQATQGASALTPGAHRHDSAEGATTFTSVEKGPIIMVQFKMGALASKTFTGELVLGERAKASSSAVVAYLDDNGREEKVDVPLKLIELLSINHQ